MPLICKHPLSHLCVRRRRCTTRFRCKESVRIVSSGGAVPATLFSPPVPSAEELLPGDAALHHQIEDALNLRLHLAALEDSKGARNGFGGCQSGRYMFGP